MKKYQCLPKYLSLQGKKYSMVTSVTLEIFPIDNNFCKPMIILDHLDEQIVFRISEKICLVFVHAYLSSIHTSLRCSQFVQNWSSGLMS